MMKLIKQPRIVTVRLLSIGVAGIYGSLAMLAEQSLTTATLSIAAWIPSQPQVVKTLQRQTRLPIYLPNGPNEDKIYPYIQASPDRYAVSFDFTPDCHSATACSIGEISAERGGQYSKFDNPPPPHAEDKPVKLARNLEGRYTHGCGAYCSATVAWKSQNVLYRIYLKNGNQARVVQLANSAIQAGLRGTTQMPPRGIYPAGTTGSLIAVENSTKPVPIRDGASLQSYTRHIGYSGDQVQILRYETGADQFTWFKVRFPESQATGWVRSNNIYVSGR